jgi:hypothetical protein
MKISAHNSNTSCSQWLPKPQTSNNSPPSPALVLMFPKFPLGYWPRSSCKVETKLIRWLLIFAGHRNRNSLMLPFRRLEFWGNSGIFNTFLHPRLSHLAWTFLPKYHCRPGLYSARKNYFFCIIKINVCSSVLSWLGYYSVVFHRRGSGLLTCLCIWYLSWNNWQWGRIYSECFTLLSECQSTKAP